MKTKQRYIVRYFVAATSHVCSACNNTFDKSEQFVRLEATRANDTTKELCINCYAGWTKRNDALEATK